MSNKHPVTIDKRPDPTRTAPEESSATKEEPEVRDRIPSPPHLAGPKQFPGEKDGPRGPEPTRYGDWEKGGRCSDF